MWFLERESPGPAVVLGSLHGESDPQASLPQALIHLKTGDESLERRGEVGAAFLEVLLLQQKWTVQDRLEDRTDTGFIFADAICVIQVKLACHLQRIHFPV